MLFKATKWTGTVVSSEEGQMEWIEYGKISNVKTVDDFAELLDVINSPELTDFQYVIEGDEWIVTIR